MSVVLIPLLKSKQMERSGAFIRTGLVGRIGFDSNKKLIQTRGQLGEGNRARSDRGVQLDPRRGSRRGGAKFALFASIRLYCEAVSRPALVKHRDVQQGVVQRLLLRTTRNLSGGQK